MKTVCKRRKKAVSDYKTEHGGLLESAQKSENDNLALLKARRDDLVITTQNGGVKTQMLEAQLAQTPPKIVFEQILSDSPAVKTLAFLQNKRTLLLADNSTVGSDRVKAVDQQIAAVKKTMQKEAAERAANPNASPFATGRNQCFANPHTRQPQLQCASAAGVKCPR